MGGPTCHRVAPGKAAAPDAPWVTKPRTAVKARKVEFIDELIARCLPRLSPSRFSQSSANKQEVTQALAKSRFSFTRPSTLPSLAGL